MEPTASPCWLGWDGLHLPIPLLSPPPMHDLGVAFGGAEPTDTDSQRLSHSTIHMHADSLPTVVLTLTPSNPIQSNDSPYKKKSNATQQSELGSGIPIPEYSGSCAWTLSLKLAN